MTKPKGFVIKVIGKMKKLIRFETKHMGFAIKPMVYPTKFMG